MNFIDEATIHVEAGRGGNGVVAFRREKFVPRGGPSGGDGGHGGSVYVIARAGLNTLYHLKVPSQYRAERGRHGEGSNRTGKSGERFEVRVPLGTVVWDVESGEMLGELLEDGEELCVAKGGRGGRGNARFASSTRQAPRHAEPGREGEERDIRLELKLLADVGVVGLPNAGKSTFISVVTAARPKIADYPFTTLVPQLGVVASDSMGEPFVIADLPGLIEGAAQGAGLGHRFLRHVERCRILVHLVELSGLDESGAGSQQNALEELETIENELEAFDPELLERPRLLVGSKVDAASDERREALRTAAGQRSLPYFEISAVTHEGLDALLSELRRMLDTPEPEHREAEHREPEHREPEDPPGLEGRGRR